MRRLVFVTAALSVCLLPFAARSSSGQQGPATDSPPGFRIQLETVLEHDDGNFLWFHPRAAAVPRSGQPDAPEVVMTLQQHWLTHRDALYLVYTRRGADNDHVFRHRAPLFIARVDPDQLHVLRRSERVLIPERGATLGNFGAARITAGESWVTVAEGVWNDDARRRGAQGAVFVARVIWDP